MRIIFVYSGHGDFKTVNGHRMSFPDEPLPTDNIFQILESRSRQEHLQIPLIAVFTDACSVLVGEREPAARYYAGRGTQPGRLSALFLQTTGRVQINAAIQGTTAAALRSGGVLVQALCGYLEDDADTGPISWRWFMYKLQDRMDHIYADRGLPDRVRGPDDKRQSTQRPQAFRLPFDKRFAEPTIPFFAGLPIPKESPAGRGGADIQEIKSPADRLLKRGDVITEVDGLKVRNWDELSCILEFHTPSPSIQVKFLRDGQHMEGSVERVQNSNFKK